MVLAAMQGDASHRSFFNLQIPITGKAETKLKENLFTNLHKSSAEFPELCQRHAKNVWEKEKAETRIPKRL